jgi:hypothetical protein
MSGTDQDFFDTSRIGSRTDQTQSYPFNCVFEIIYNLMVIKNYICATNYILINIKLFKNI